MNRTWITFKTSGDKNDSAKFDMPKVHYRCIPKACQEKEEEAHAEVKWNILKKKKKMQRKSKISTIAFK